MTFGFFDSFEHSQSTMPIAHAKTDVIKHRDINSILMLLSNIETPNIMKNITEIIQNMIAKVDIFNSVLVLGHHNYSTLRVSV